MLKAKRALLETIGAGFGLGRVLVAVDGIDGAGKTRFADDLAAVLGESGRAAFRASMDDFHRPRAERYARGRDSAEGFYRDSYDYSAFRRVVVDPFLMGGSTAWVPALFDVTRDARVEPVWQTGPADAVLIIDGIFLNRRELRDIWRWSAWLEVSDGVAAARLLERDGTPTVVPRYLGGRALYLAEAEPRSAASVVLDNDDFERPRLLPA